MNTSEVMREVDEGIRPLRRAEFEQLARAGCFDHERVELLFGAMVEMPRTDPAHDHAKCLLVERLMQQLGDRAQVRISGAFAASEHSEPRPDVVVAPTREYWTEYPSRALLVVEIAHASLELDRGLKARLYGSGEVDEYWIVDVANRVVEVYREPRDDGRWGDVRVHERGARLSPVAWPEVVILADEILPPA